MDVYVFDKDLNRIGIVDDYINLKVVRNYRKLGYIELRVGADEQLINLLQKGRIISTSDDLQRGYIIETFEYSDSGATEITIHAPSLNSILGRRIVLTQQEFSGNIENVIKSFVLNNATNPTNTKRKINRLVIAPNTGFDITGTEGTANKQLDEYLYTVTNKHDISWRILMDIRAKQFIFSVWQGVDRSTEQSINPRVIFSKEFDNILTQDYIDSDSDYRSTAYIAGEDTDNRIYVVSNDQFSDLDRFEMFVDANNIKQNYKDGDTDINLSLIQYRELLLQNGNGKLAEKAKIQTFESKVDMFSQFVYGRDYFLGDKVSIRNSELGITLHTRVISSTEIYDREGVDLSVDFGENIPSFIDKIKRTVN